MSNAPSSTSECLEAVPLDPHLVRPLPAPDPRRAPYRRWIELRESMTRAIGAHLGAEPRVHPVFEGPALLATWEQRLLGLRASPGYAREVVLTVKNRAVLSARTVGRLDDPALEVIRRLGNRPLAQLLFEDPRWARITPAIPLLELKSRRVGRACLWEGHGSIAKRRPSRILVSEFFESGALAP